MCSTFKVIIDKSHGEVPLLEQDIIENVSAAYLEFMIIFFTFILCNSCGRYNIFFVYENLKKPPSKVAHNRPQIFFLYCQPAQITISIL